MFLLNSDLKFLPLGTGSFGTLRFADFSFCLVPRKHKIARAARGLGGFCLCSRRKEDLDSHWCLEIMVAPLQWELRVCVGLEGGHKYSP